jgi:hypothetical protein
MGICKGMPSPEPNQISLHCRMGIQQYFFVCDRVEKGEAISRQDYVRALIDREMAIVREKEKISELTRLRDERKSLEESLKKKKLK